MKRAKQIRGAVTYHRVSTLEQHPEIARRELRRCVKARGLTLVGEYEETGSGANNDRPKMLEVIELARKGLISHVFVWKLDRFGRSNIDLLLNIRELERCGVTFVATSQGLEVGPECEGFTSRLTLAVLAAVAENDLIKIRENTRLGMAAARARGVHIGRPRKIRPTTTGEGNA